MWTMQKESQDQTMTVEAYWVWTWSKKYKTIDVVWEKVVELQFCMDYFPNKFVS